MAVAMAAAAAFATSIAARALRGKGRPAMVAGPAFRMLCALAGVAAGVGLKPPSVGLFVGSFLVVYIAGIAVVFFRFEGRVGR
jgi:hypothetical protein